MGQEVKVILGNVSSLEEATRQLLLLRKYKPFKYGGRWFVMYHCGEGFAFRSMKAIHNKAAKLGILDKGVEIVAVEKQM